jgi:predicted membrane protein
LLFFFCSVSTAWPQAQSKPTIIRFDVPGAGTAAGQGTIPNGITSAGGITGWYLDANNAYHGFLRTPDGSITTFDAPGAGTGTGQGTIAYGMNASRAITGVYSDANNVFHGFLRARDGTFATFDAPGAGTASGEGTSGTNINPTGTITGDYVDASNVIHGLVRAPDGKITEFDTPGAGTGAFQGVESSTFYGLNPAGALAAFYSDADYATHGFVRAPDGQITEFDPPGAGTGAGQGTIADSINPEGTIAGFFVDAS